VIVTFNRMKQLSTDYRVIVAAVNASQSGIIEVHSVVHYVIRYYSGLYTMLSWSSVVVSMSSCSYQLLVLAR